MTLLDADGAPAAIVGNTRDVTDQKAAEERLRDLSRRLIQAQEEERGTSPASCTTRSARPSRPSC